MRTDLTATPTAQLIEAHRRAGRRFNAAGVNSFVREQGRGETVLCMHGLWGSSFPYRKLLPELARHDLRGVAFDLPGFGLADRPRDFDYSWTGLGGFAAAAVARLGLERCHLVVHDIGGPVGFELAHLVPDRVASLTILNTVIDVATFTPPWSMRPFRHRVLGEAWRAGLRPAMFRRLMRLQGVGDPSAVTPAELDVYLRLMKGDDGGRAFLRVIRSAPTTVDRQERYRAVVGGTRPVQIVWAGDDPAMPLVTYGRQALAATGLDTMTILPGKHFPQEDQSPALAHHIARFVRAQSRPDENRATSIRSETRTRPLS
jgi:pimeloyl-ACP methyl ester carboxylesterase